MTECPAIATHDVDLNAATIGLPAILTARQADQGPVRIPAGRDVDLTFRNPADADAYVVAHTMMMWRFDNGSLVPLDPTPAALGAAPIDVRLRFVESSGRDLHDAETHWANLATLPGRPHRWPVPQWIAARAVLTVRVRNYDDLSDVAVSFHPIVRRQTSGALGRELRGQVNVAELDAEHLRCTSPLTTWPARNVQGPGVPVLAFSADGPALVEAGTFAAPGPVVSRRIATHGDYWLHIDRLLAAIHVDGQTLTDRDMRVPVFARLRDSRNNLHLTDGWVPLGCLCGTAEYPALLPAEWVTPKAGTLIYELRSMHGTDATVGVGVGGFYRTEV